VTDDGAYFVIQTAGGQEAHLRGDLDCLECVYPVANPCPCGGVVHFYDYDEDDEGDDWWSSRCDRCGKTWYDVSSELPQTFR
jgi:hypothetical protein